MTGTPGQPSTRGQSSVVGVAILIGITMLALGSMAAAVGGVVNDAAIDADVKRVTADFERAFQPVETTGHHRARIRFGSGALLTETRTVRILNPDGPVETYDTNTVTYAPSGESHSGGDGRRVTFLAGAILVTQGDYTRVVRPPPIASGPGVLVVGLPVLTDTVSIGGNRLDLTVETRVSHSRRTLGTDDWRVAVETTTPDAWNRTLRQSGASSITTRDYDGDGIQSVVATYDTQRTAHLVVHDMTMEVHQ